MNETVGSTLFKQGKQEYMFPKLKRGFKVAHLNINRLYNTLDSEKELLQHTSLDVLALTETWLSPNIDNGELEIEGYSFFHEDRRANGKSEGGGVIIYVKNCLQAVPQQDILSAKIEEIVTKVERPRCKSMLVGAFYRLLDFDPYKFNESLINSDKVLDTTKNKLLVMGDCNIDLSSTNSKMLKHFSHFYYIMTCSK